MFFYQQKLPFKAAFEWFSGQNSPKCCQFCLTSDDIQDVVLRQVSSAQDIWLWSLKFLYWFSIHEMTPSESFLGLHSPKYCSNLLKCWPEVVPNKINTVFQKPFKILNFGSNGTHTKFTVFVYFGAQFTARKLKILLNTWISAKTTYILRNVKQFKFQVPEKSYYPCKIKQKKYCLCPNLV